MTDAKRKKVEAISAILGLLLLFLLTAPTTLPDMDSGEFATIAVVGGIAHPPGYPLLSLLYQLVALPFGTDHLIALLSGTSILFTLGAAWLIWRTTACFMGDERLALLATLIVFTASPVWRVATTIEPFALNLLLSAACLYSLWLASLGSTTRHRLGATFCVGLTFGLSFCNHHSMAFLLPATGLILWRAPDQLAAKAARFAAGSLCGLLPLAYFFTQTDAPYVWGAWEGIGDFVGHLLRSEYGTTSLVLGATGSIWAGPTMFLEAAFVTLSYLFAGLLIWGIALVCQTFATKNQAPDENLRTWFAISLLVSIGMCGMVFPSLFRLNPNEPWHQLVADRFFALPLMLSAPLLALGLQRLVGLSVNPLVVKGGLLLVLTAHIGANFFASNRADERFFADHLQNVISTVNNKAVIVTDSDPDFMGFLYVRHVMVPERAIHLIHMGLIDTPWYRRHLLRELDLKNTDFATITTLVDAISARYQVYALTTSERLRAALENSYPEGPLIRLLPMDISPPPPTAVFLRNLKLYRDVFALPTAEDIAMMTPWDQFLVGHYRRTWEVLCSSLQGDGAEMQQICDYYLQNLRTEIAATKDAAASGI